MKRCPTCNRAHDEALKFCPKDGTPLVDDGGSAGEDAGTVRFDSAPATGETETRILPTGEGMGRPTAPTTVLEGRQPSGDTQGLSGAKSRRGILIVLTVVLAAALAASAYLYLQRGNSSSVKDSIAVLPFQNATADPNMEYLSDGISESLINSLSRLPNVRVLARGTMFRFKGKDADPQEVGRQLGVDTVLTGRVVRVGDSLTVQADLVSVADGSQMWGERYSRKAADALAVQEDIAREIVGRLRPKLGWEERGRVSKRYTEDAEAYQLYLQGRYHWNKRSPEELRRAIDYFKQAIALDPNYALAYTGLADTYGVLHVRDETTVATETMPLAREAAEKALALDEGLAEAHVSLAHVLYSYEYRWDDAERHFKRALELNPNYPTLRQWYGTMLIHQGRFDEGLAETRRALELDPFSLIINTAFGGNLNYARRYDEAIAQFLKTRELDPNFGGLNFFMYEAYANKGMHPEAVASLVRQMKRNGDPPGDIKAAEEAFDKAGWQGFLRQTIKSVEGKGRPSYYADDIASLYARLGEKDKAIAWLEKAYEVRHDKMTAIKVDPRYDSLRSDPRFADLLRKVGLPQ